ncbi:MAG TPA: CHAT domain-containing protein, partial [Usitatibacter sp.]|nr:CHAT domain-containing protein [Usitatibacter sp.]
MGPIRFMVPGALVQGGRARLQAQRGDAEATALVAVPGRHVVKLEIAGGPTLTLHPENARDLMLAQSGATLPVEGTDQPVTVPPRLRWKGFEQAAQARSARRGAVSDAVLASVEVVEGGYSPADLVAEAIVQHFDASVDAGLWRLARTGRSPLDMGKKVDALAASDKPQLILVHGSFSRTDATFLKLWQEHPQLVARLFATYGDGGVYAFEHATLGLSPAENALALAKSLPQNAAVHFLTHSRGGLVTEALARACAAGSFTADDSRFFADPAWKHDRDALAELVAVARDRQLRVARIVRVACPSRGTLLASRRLDAYVSVLRWCMELAGVPIAPSILEFIGKVAQSGLDPRLVPGLAAEAPDSPLVQWLHAAPAPIAGDLRVVAGDMEGDSVTSWLKTLLADAYYWTDNDLIVQTRSMYGGAPREGGATFMLDRGGKVSHFAYFGNESTANAIVAAVESASPPGDFRTIGPLSWSGSSPTGLRAGPAADTGDKPAVIVLPGVLGSNLAVDGKRIWLDWRVVNGLDRLAYDPARPDGVLPDGPVGSEYGDLLSFLARSHHVIAQAFDWRRPMEEAARLLAGVVAEALRVREHTGQPVRILAHSMGGLVARAMQLEQPEVWDRMMARPGARVLMLGTPNQGSWAPMQVLSGDDDLGNLLTLVGLPFRDHAARQIIANFPGFLQTQAGLANGLGTSAQWAALAAQDLAAVKEYNFWHSDGLQLDVYRWGVPSDEAMARAVALRRRLDTQREETLPRYADRMAIVLGRAAFTPDGYEMTNEGLVYLDAKDGGDGRVAAENALLPNVGAWVADCDHGMLPRETSAFDAYFELLDRGTTDRLPRRDPSGGSRGTPPRAPVRLRTRPSRSAPTPKPPQEPGEALQPRRAVANPAAGRTVAALQVTVLHGDLRFVSRPLLIGHYRAMRLTGTEAVVDRLLQGAMSESLDAGVYPMGTGGHEVFVNPAPDAETASAPTVVIVVGLGEEGKLQAVRLIETVRNAVIGWARHATEPPRVAPATIEIAATLIGSGGTGIAPAQAAQLVAEGVRQANVRLADTRYPLVSHLVLVEIFLDRAQEAWRAIETQVAATPAYFRLTPQIEEGTGGFTRPLEADYRGADYDFVSAMADDESKTADLEICYTLDTRRARSEVHAQAMQARLVEKLVQKASNDWNGDPRIGRTLFNLLVPIEMHPFLAASGDTVIEVNERTAGIPWEMLDTGSNGGGDERPWAIRCKLLRKMRTADFRPRVRDALSEDSVLVIGEPHCPANYPRLPGARAEARAVAQMLSDPDEGRVDVIPLIAPDDDALTGFQADAIVEALLSRPWRMVHIAGHGQAQQADGTVAGVVLSDEVFLGPREIRTMAVVPELVFVNCCHLGVGPGVMKPDQPRPQFAASVAKQLIDIGVRCVVAAGWAVDDAAASAFATTFYRSLLRGER